MTVFRWIQQFGGEKDDSDLIATLHQLRLGTDAFDLAADLAGRQRRAELLDRQLLRSKSFGRLLQGGGIGDPVRTFERQTERATALGHGCTARSSSAARETASE